MTLLSKLLGKEDGAEPPKPDVLDFSGDIQTPTNGGKNPAENSAAAGIISDRKKRADSGKPRGPRTGKLSEAEAQTLTAFENLYKPEVWEGIVCMPADTMLAVSGRKTWDISQRERQQLSVTASVTARCFAVENPKWLALTMLCITLTQVYGSRTAMHLAEREKEKKEALKNAPKP